MGGIPAPSQDSSVAGGGISLLRSRYIVHEFTASVKQLLPIAAIVPCDGIAAASAIVGIADHGSFSAAADALQTVQSNISAHVKKLDRELGCELVDRTTGQLTEAGEIVVARSRRSPGGARRDALRRSGANARGGRNRQDRDNRDDRPRWLVPQLLRDAPKRYPHLHLVFVETPITRLDTQVSTGQVDIAVVDLPTEGGADLAVTPLFEEELVLVVPVERASRTFWRGEPQ